MNHPTEIADLEEDLRRRLADIAATTTVERDAWETITRRAAGRTSRRRPTRRQAVAVAAAAAVALVGGLALSRDRRDQTETVDDTTTTTDHTSSSTTDPPRTSTTVPGDPSLDRAGSSPSPGEGGDAGGTAPDGETTRGTGDPGGSEAAAGAAPSPGGDGQAPGTTTPQAAPTAADGRPIAASVAHNGHTYGITAFENGGNLYINLWRDVSYYLTMSSWPLEPGRNCLAGEMTIYTEGEESIVRWGVVRADAAGVDIVTSAGGRSSAAVSSPVVSRVSAWIGLHPGGDVDRYEAYDSAGSILHVATAPDWNAAGSC